MKPVRLYIGFQIFFSLLIWLPIFYEFQKRVGLTDSEIFTIQSIYYIAFCALEIPTGLIADLWGYGRCMKAGAATLMLASLLPIFMPNYAGFLSHFLLVALARSFVSGASSAYLFEYLVERGEKESFKQIEGNARAYGLVAKVICWAGVGALMEWKLTLPYWLTFGAASISLVYALLLPPLRSRIISKSNSIGRETLTRLAGMFQQVALHPYLLFLMLQGVAIFVLGRIVQVNLFQPILNSKAIALPVHGIVMSAMTVFEALGSARPGVMKQFFNDQNAVTFLTLALACSLGVLPWAGVYGTIAILCVFALVSGLAYPIQRHLFNDSIRDASYRATLLSMESIIDRAACAFVATLLAGAVVGTTSGLNSFLWRSCVVTGAGILLLAGALWVKDKGRIKT
jgi:MFS family permease